MKKAGIFLVITMIMAGCGGNRKSNNQSEAFITVDITAGYPKKELILQDFMDMEYIALETTDDFLCQGIVLAVGRGIILVKNQNNDGNIFVYDRNGKGLRIINRRGQGGEEYLRISEIALDEANGEMFVNDFSLGKIMVYDLFGKFKRSFRYERGAYGEIYIFDNENLICYDSSFNPSAKTDKSSFFLISKQGGSIVKEIQIDIRQKKTPTGLRVESGNIRIDASAYFPIIPYSDSWILTEYSSDTIFRFLPDYSLIPFIGRTPSIQSMNPELLFYPGIITNRYLFMKTEMNETGAGNVARGVLTKAQLVYDKQEGVISEYTVLNNDYSTRQTVDMAKKTISKEIAFWQKIEAYELVDAYKKGEVKGQLKEIAAQLEEESNPVIMLVKYKK